jgi:hypothetical protein
MSEPDTVPRSSLFADLLQLGRILALRPPRPGGLSPDIGKLPWLILLYGLISIASAIAFAITQENTSGAIALDVGVFIPFGGILFIAGLLKWIDRRQATGNVWLVFALLLLPLPLVAFIGAELWTLAPWLDFVDWIKHASSSLPGPVAWLTGTLPHAISLSPYLWLALAGTLYAARVTQGGGWRRGLSLPLVPPALFTLLTSIDPLALWQTPTEEAESVPDRLVFDEEVFYAQPRLLAEQLDGIKAGKVGVSEIFFLGVAGNQEGVFMREAVAVEQLFKDRYATAGHSALLVNNVTTARKLPFANRESLSRALRRIGERMNGEEDLLFLFLTSHGSESHRFSIQLPPLEFSDITPNMLRKALDDSGIGRRVIVVSACYSGGFIPALANSKTLVITAAAADRNSFGCDDTNTLTDFGRAYFDEALRETRSLTEAFEHAKTLIANREAASGITPSLPQIAGGESLRAQLEWFARERK